MTQKEIETSKIHILELKENIENQKIMLSKFETLSDKEKKEVASKEENNNEKAMKAIDNILEKSSHFSGFISSLPHLP